MVKIESEESWTEGRKKQYFVTRGQWRREREWFKMNIRELARAQLGQVYGHGRIPSTFEWHGTVLQKINDFNSHVNKIF